MNCRSIMSMSLLRTMRPRSHTTSGICSKSRGYATVDERLPDHHELPPLPDLPRLSKLEEQILSGPSGGLNLRDIIHQYLGNCGRVTPYTLPYESRPSASRRVNFDPDTSAAVRMVAHYTADPDSGRSKVTLASGFAVSTRNAESEEEPLLLTCAHTLEEIRYSSLYRALECKAEARSGSYIIQSTPPSIGLNSISLTPVTSVLSSLHRSDLLLLQSGNQDGGRTLPMSPYPAAAGTVIRAHFVSHATERPQGDGWMPWIGGTWSQWIRGKVLGYRDFSGRETEPGTYDSLAHLLFEPPPSAGSSGGPIVDEGSGAVVGIMLGTRMDNRVEGLRGWGVPSETAYEMFTLPGLAGKR